MSNERRVLVHPDKEALAAAVAARFLTKIIDVLEEQERAHVCLTGGTMGSAVLEAIASSPARDTVDWSRIHFWWSDERYLPRGDAERNETQSRAALLDVAREVRVVFETSPMRGSSAHALHTRGMRKFGGFL